MDELLDKAPCGFLTVTDNSRLVEINTTLLDLLGYQREQLKNVQIKKLFSPPEIYSTRHIFFRS